MAQAIARTGLLTHNPEGSMGETGLRIVLILLALVLLTSCMPGERKRIADYRTIGELHVATRMDAISYVQGDNGQASGFEHDLVQELGRELGVPVRFVVYPDAMRAIDAVLRGEVHLAAAALARNDRLPLHWSAPLRKLDFVLAGRRGTPTISEEKDLAGRTIAVRRGSVAASRITDLQRRVPGLKAHYPLRRTDQILLAQLADDQHDLVATDRAHFALAAQIHPDLEIKYEWSSHSEIAWAMPIATDGNLATRIEQFLERAMSSELITRIADRHFLHVHRITRADTTAFLKRIDERLPTYRGYFHEAQVETGIDWRYLAALAYQESHWDPLARSRTGVRGMMMLTAETADRLGVANRLDARESILGGARYLAMLRDSLPDEISEPDRTWLATAAYNLGMGHLNGGRAIARSLNKDDTSWWDMKAVLPLLARPEYAARLKAGRARGGEAVIMTENIRNYYGILTRIEPAHVPPLRRGGIKLAVETDEAPKALSVQAR